MQPVFDQLTTWFPGMGPIAQTIIVVAAIVAAVCFGTAAVVGLYVLKLRIQLHRALQAERRTGR